MVMYVDKKPVNKKRLAVHIVIEASIFILIFFVLFWPFRVSGQSMEPHFKSGGTVAASRLLAWAGSINRGDVIICRTYHYDRPQRAIKRVIGLPGEHIQILDGKVFVNGTELPHSHETPGVEDIVLADNEFYVLGDVRSKSYDSRLAGVVNRRDIIAKVLFSRAY
jgi:signal peptidase I